MIKNGIELSKYACKFQVGNCLMQNKSYVVFEGMTDILFFRRFIQRDGKESRFFCAQAGGRGNVEKNIRQYREALDNSEDYPRALASVYFCLDRDYDSLMGLKPQYKDEFVGYQMWDVWSGEEKESYNDLESFLFSTKHLDYLLTQVYGVSEEKVTLYREIVAKTASCLGAFRYASRAFQKEKRLGRSILCCQRETVDSFNDEKTVTEICEFTIESLLASGDLSFSEDQIHYDFNNLKKRLNQMSLEYSGYESSYIKDVLDIAEEKWKTARLPAAGLQYCRGHDLTEILYYLLRERRNGVIPKSVDEIELNLYSLPPSQHPARKDIIEKLKNFPISRAFDEELFEKVARGEIE